ncbi:MAG: helix-turn-helix transcriptional regulator [Eubacterium sp.]|nr:helix-turn-helix transcriptional regulator [Eubacterium sp.]
MRFSKELSAGTIPTMVLSVIKSEDMYGYKIIKTLEVRSDNVFSLKEGTLYPILHAMEKEDLLESYWEVADGRKRKYYHITKKGLRRLAEKAEEFEQFSATVKQVLSFA